MQLLFSFVMVSGLYRFFVVLVVLPVFASLPKLKLPGIIYYLLCNEIQENID